MSDAVSFRIDPEIRSHIPPLRDDELRQLEENIKRDGCKSPLVVWDGILLDGHNRYDICSRNGLAFQVEEISLPDRPTAIAWIEDNQLGRRNLTADQFAYFIGRKYERYKKAPGTRTDLTSDQNDTRLQSADIVAAQHGVSAPTVKRAADFARNVDAIADAVGENARSELLSGSVGATRADVKEVAEAVAERPEELRFKSAKEAFDWVKRNRAEQAETKRDERIAKIAEIAKGNSELETDRKYPVIYADPPWRYENPPMGGGNRSIENHYPTMSLEEICALPVAELATEDAILYMWATAPKLAECMKVIEAWGFDYRTNFVWVKDKIGMGYHARSQHEILLVAKRGSIPPPAVADRVSSVVFGERGEHSAKPAEFYELIESFYPTLPKIELFCRSPREGWAVWGNQSRAA